MINDKTKSSDRLTGKQYGDLILDMGASHHMIGELSFLQNKVSIPPCPVGFAGTTRKRVMQALQEKG